MPGLISSSSSSGPKAAPKSAPRRRPPPSSSRAPPKTVAAVPSSSNSIVTPDPLPQHDDRVQESNDSGAANSSVRESDAQKSARILATDDRVATERSSVVTSSVDDQHLLSTRREERDVANDARSTHDSGNARSEETSGPIVDASGGSENTAEANTLQMLSAAIRAIGPDESTTVASGAVTTVPDPGTTQLSPALALTSAPDKRTRSGPGESAEVSAKRSKRSRAGSGKSKQQASENGNEQGNEGVSAIVGDTNTYRSMAENSQHGSEPEPAKSRRSNIGTETTRKSRARGASINVTSDDPHAEPSMSSKNPTNKRRRRGTKAVEDPTGQVTNTDPGQPDEDPELHEINPNRLSMWDLSYDTVHGKTSELGRRMAEIDWKEVNRTRRLEESGQQAVTEAVPADGVVLSVEGQGINVTSQAVDAVAAEVADDGGDIELQMDADGNIIANDEALVRVLNAEAEAAANSGQPVTEENPLTTRINRTTWINANKRDPADRVPLARGKSDPWSDEETDRFYDALRMFGTDFFIISKMFAPKTRRMIKAKFTREERLDPARLNRALLGLESTPMDLEHYARETGQDVSSFTKYESIEEADAAMREELRTTQAQMTATIEEAADAETKAEQEKQKQREKRRAAKGNRRKKRAGGTMGGLPDDGD